LQVEWIIRREARTGWGSVETIEVGYLKQRVVGLTDEELGRPQKLCPDQKALALSPVREGRPISEVARTC